MAGSVDAVVLDTSGADTEAADDSPGSARGVVEGLAGGVSEAVVARPKRDANGLERRAAGPLDGVGSDCLAPGRGGRGGPFARGRGGKGRLPACPWTEKAGYAGPSREF